MIQVNFLIYKNTTFYDQAIFCDMVDSRIKQVEKKKTTNSKIGRPAQALVKIIKTKLNVKIIPIGITISSPIFDLYEVMILISNSLQINYVKLKR